MPAAAAAGPCACSMCFSKGAGISSYNRRFKPVHMGAYNSSSSSRMQPRDSWCLAMQQQQEQQQQLVHVPAVCALAREQASVAIIDGLSLCTWAPTIAAAAAAAAGPCACSMCFSKGAGISSYNRRFKPVHMGAYNSSSSSSSRMQPRDSWCLAMQQQQEQQQQLVHVPAVCALASEQASLAIIDGLSLCT